MQGTLSVSDYFTQLKVYWDELESYRPVLPCSCTIPCLNEKFSSSKSRIMMMTPFLDIDHAFSIMIQQERGLTSLSSLDLPSDDTIAPTAISQVNSTQNNGGNRYWNPNSKGRTSSSRHNKACTHCGRTSHTVETCFVKHGYPPGFKNKP
ncbi:hypothetical protein KIW84_076700 [Lathyrus oleraceus]|uniref:Retrotransposon gag domain-containing protein n=1 Tax=Pisum sativum TaxID=3888 RepID=A0A9D4VXJ2_PEA|nr:hypothetical protein KIW84_076700 [Pisum sativum]